jgi:hypothetical protein
MFITHITTQNIILKVDALEIVGALRKEGERQTIINKGL